MNRLHYDIGFGWGVAACKRGAARIPAADSRIMDFIREKREKDGSSISLLKGWLAGYEWQIGQNMISTGF